MSIYYANDVGGFLGDDDDKVLGTLTRSLASLGIQQQEKLQTEAWQSQILLLKELLRNTPSAKHWGLILEYVIPRRGKRVDAVLLIKDIIVVCEFKIGANTYPLDAVRQAEDYALDLRDFHNQSAGRIIVPLLICTEAPNLSGFEIDNSPEKVKPPVRSNKDSLRMTLSKLEDAYSLQDSQISWKLWAESEYKPTPTIIEAAQALYEGMHVSAITRHHAGAENLTKTTEAVLKVIEEARVKRKKVICFLTGVPGAGKTLAGLNIVHNRDLHAGDLGVFLSGNGPLVRVLSAALARDHAERTDISRAESMRKVSTFIQNVHRFIEPYYENGNVPVDKIIVFDEAQRAWDAKQSLRKFQRNISEAEILLGIMDRQPDWAVIVALIGGGQEINSGEAGLPAWGEAISQRFYHWEVVISPVLKDGHHSTAGQPLFEKVPEHVHIREDLNLHLDVCIRSYRAEKVSRFVADLLDGHSETAKQILQSDLKDYPIYLTRSLDVARAWLKKKERGLRRVGIIASSGARRLKAFGLDVTKELAVEEWFLNRWDDVRSSYYLEDPATEFGIQGLEIDWACVAWGGDFRISKDGSEYWQFRGTKWQKAAQSERKRFIKNKYRVLLTRSREGFIIFVPEGSDEDHTRKKQFYDATYNYLHMNCCIPVI